MNILTDTVLRAHWFKTHDHEYVTAEDTLLTPAAKDFIKEQNIRLVIRGSENDDTSYEPMPVAKAENGGGRPAFTDALTGRQMTKKPEYMTHLHGSCLVYKTDERIELRGQLDRLEAEIMQVQIMAQKKKKDKLIADLSEILNYVRAILGAEVTGRKVPAVKFLGLDSEELRSESHHVREIYGISHPTPDFKMGEICMALNHLRTTVRTAELSAAKAFCWDGGCVRTDLIEGLNRISSAVYILFIRELTGKGRDRLPIPVEASGRHVHLTKAALCTLFGKESLTKKSDLSQPGQFAACERVTLMTSKGEIERVAVLGPVRDEVQVEISLTDAKILGIEVPVNLSGDLTDAADVIIAGSKGVYNATGSVIAAKAHIHMTPEDALRFGVADKDIVSVRLECVRPVTLEEVVVRVSDRFMLAMHLDYDEANAARFKKGDAGYIIGGGRSNEK